MRFVRPKSIGRLHCCGTRQEFRLILPLAAFVLLPLASGAAVGMAQAAPGGTVDFSAVLPPQKPALEVGAPSVLPAPKPQKFAESSDESQNESALTARDLDRPVVDPAALPLPAESSKPAIVSGAADIIKLAYGPQNEAPQQTDVAEPAELREEVVEVGSGDTLIGLLQRAGIGTGEAYGAVNALQAVFSPRGLRPGQQIELALELQENSNGEAKSRLAGLSLRASIEEDVQLRRDADGEFVAESVARPLARGIDGAAGTIRSSLFVDGESLDVPPAVMLEMIRALSYAVDFQRDLRNGDAFEIVYETLSDAEGSLARSGALLFASVEVRNARLEMYRHESADGTVDYFDSDGESLRRLLMRTPIDGARLSSGFGMRKHPVLGYSRMHRGVDFAAPPGTPIYAAGNGVVEVAGRNGGYGNYVRIRHNGDYKTVYAHLSRFASPTRRGNRVSQGQVIGYVGSTGTATGPHLHYEVMVNGEQVNPRSLDLPTGQRLEGEERARFKQTMAEMDAARDGLAVDTRVAQAAQVRPAGMDDESR